MRCVGANHRLSSKQLNRRDKIDAFLLDFPNARDRAVALDEKLMSEAGKVSDQYADLISFATRQTLGGLEFTTSRVTDGSYDPSDLQIFMKDIGSNG